MTIDRRSMLLGSTMAALAASGLAASDPPPRERVDGIGGFFFRSRNPKSLSEWYQRNLGIDPIPTDYGHKPWQQAAGPTALAPFPMDSDYFGSPTQSWMVNFQSAQPGRDGGAAACRRHRGRC